MMLIDEDQGPESPQKSLRSGTGSTTRPAKTPYDPPSYDDALVSSSLASLASSLTSPMSTSPHYNYQAIPPSTPPLPLPQGSEADSARRRFVSGVAIAFITYLALVSFMSVHHGFHVEASDVHRLEEVARLIFFFNRSRTWSPLLFPIHHPVISLVLRRTMAR